jgi:hypothetical protein
MASFASCARYLAARIPGGDIEMNNPARTYRQLIMGLAACLIAGACTEVTPPPVEETSKVTTVTVSAARATAMLGETVQATAEAKDQDGNAMSPAFAWTTSDAQVATVDPNGLITPVGTGSASITATADTKQGAVAIAVAGSLHNANITSSQTWRARDNPHRVEGNVRVGGASTATLTVEPGVEIRVASGGTLTFGGAQAGALMAMGTAAQPIQFISNSSSASGGDWTGLSFETASDASELHYVTVSHCGRAPEGACIDINEARVLFDNVTVQQSAGRGVWLSGSAAFRAGSTMLNVTGSASYALRIVANYGGTIPTGGTFPPEAHLPGMLVTPCCSTGMATTPFGRRKPGRIWEYHMSSACPLRSAEPRRRR